MAELLPQQHWMLHASSRKAPPANLYPWIVAELIKFYRNPPYGMCAGIAAPQLGYPYNVFIAQDRLFKNVKKVQLVGEPYETYESCFSCEPLRSYKVTRYPQVIVTYKMGIPGQTDWFDGYTAQVIQHEWDHIKGILISDKKGAKHG